MNAYWPYYDVWADSLTPVANIRIVSDNQRLETMLLKNHLIRNYTQLSKDMSDWVIEDVPW